MLPAQLVGLTEALPGPSEASASVRDWRQMRLPETEPQSLHLHTGAATPVPSPRLPSASVRRSSSCAVSLLSLHTDASSHVLRDEAFQKWP